MLDATSDPRDRAVLAVAMNTGLRSSEIEHLKVADVDLNTLTLRTWINKSLIDDEMPITSDLAGELRTWMRTYAKRIGRPLIPADHLLPAYAGPRIGYRKDENGTLVKYMRESVIVPNRPALKLHRIAQEALRAVGLDTKGEGIHTLRRATARAFYDSLKAQGHEAAIRQAMVLLHHSNQSTTEAYLGVTPEREARNVSLRGRSFLRRSITADVLPLRRPRL